MSNRGSGRRVAFTVCVLVASFAPRVASAEELRWRVTSYVTKLDVKPVGDVEGHVKGTYSRAGLCLLPGEVGVYAGTGTLDITKGAGTGSGEATCTFEDGSSFRTTLAMSGEPLPGGFSSFKGTADIQGGTGRFAGMTGTSTFTARTYTKFSADGARQDMVSDQVSTVSRGAPRK